MASLIAEYQCLLTADESLAALDQAVDLARRVARGGRVTDGRRWPTISWADGRSTTELHGSATSRRVSEVANLLQWLPRRAKSPDVPEAQYALLIDTLLLVFHHAYFSLLPRAAAHRKTLLQTLDVFAEEQPNMADRFQMKGLLYLERGQFDQAVQSFNAAIAATPADQHDFLTRVQMVWSLLIEHRRLNDAFNCLMDVSPRVTRLDFDEFQRLLRATFNESQKANQRRAEHIA